MFEDQSVIVLRTAPGEYEVRSASRSRAAAGAGIRLEELPAFLSADGENPLEEIGVRFVATAPLRALIVGLALKCTSVGWEGFVFPNSPHPRRRLATPANVELRHGVQGQEANWLANINSRAAYYFALPKLDKAESFLISIDSRPVGWVPVERLSAETSRISTTFLEPHVHAGDLRRLSHLRLSALSAASHHQHDLGRTVVSFIPDDGDEINPYKRQVAGFDITNHWCCVRARRDAFAAG